MKTLNLNTVLFAINVVKLDKNGLATVKFGYSKANINGKPIAWSHKVLENVKTSSLIRYRLNDEFNKNIEFNKTYYSLNNSTSRKENPFSIIKKGDTYTLKAVEQNGFSKEQIELPDGNFVDDVKWFYKSSKKYYRYINKTDKTSK